MAGGISVTLDDPGTLDSDPERRVNPLAALAIAFGAFAAHAQVTLDGTVGPAVALTGPGFAITSNLGRRAGENLFHSFARFSLLSSQTATFSSPAAVRHVVARVTGPDASFVNGRIATRLEQGGVPSAALSTASLWLINPMGVLFGPGASLETAGSFHVATADYVRLGAGAGRFYASSAAPSSFSAAAPSAFGFLGAPAPIEAAGARLAVPAGRTLSIAGGGVTLGAQSRFEAPAGRVQIASVAGAGEVALGEDLLAPAAGTALGTLRIAERAAVSVTSADDSPSGTIRVRAGRLELAAGGRLEAGTRSGGGGEGGAVEAIASEAITIDGAGGVLTGIFAISHGAGRGGRIHAEAPEVTLVNFGLIGANAAAGGAGGDIVVRAGRLELRSLGSIDAGTFIGTGGAGGEVDILARESILIDGLGSTPLGTGIFAATHGSGPAGSVRVESLGALTLANGGAILATTTSSGAGGPVTVLAHDILVQGGSWIASGSLRDGSGTGSSGPVTLRAGESVVIEGAHPDPQFQEFVSAVFAGTAGSGAGGAVTVEAPLVALRQDGLIGAFTLGTGRAGPIDILADRIELTSGGNVSSGGGDGPGGPITVRAREAVTISGSGPQGFPAAISADTVGGARAGDIVISAPRVDVSGGGHIRTISIADGAGGSITVRAGEVTLREGAQVSVLSTGRGAAGSIDIDAGRRLTMQGASRISARTETSEAGDIRIRADELVYLSGSQITTSVAGGAGNGGNIVIDPILMVLQDSQIIANARRGDGGFISIAVSGGLLSDASLIEASSELGIAGTVQILAPGGDVGASLAALGAAYLDASGLIRESCAARAGRSAQSSFTGAGRGGLAASPTGGEGVRAAPPVKAAFLSSVPNCGG